MQLLMHLGTKYIPQTLEPSSPYEAKLSHPRQFREIRTNRRQRTRRRSEISSPDSCCDLHSKHDSHFPCAQIYLKRKCANKQEAYYPRSRSLKIYHCCNHLLLRRNSDICCRYPAAHSQWIVVAVKVIAGKKDLEQRPYMIATLRCSLSHPKLSRFCIRVLRHLA